MPLPVFKRSQTALQISRFLLPLAVVAALAGLLAIGSYAFMFFPAQVRLSHATATYTNAKYTQKQKKSAWETQQALKTVWNKMPARKEFPGLSVAISSLAKTHRVRIPGMGYDIQELRDDLGIKGTLSFKAAGRYEAIRKFIYKLESKWPHLFIEKLTVERAKTPNDVAFTIKVSTFLKDEDISSPRSSSL